MVFAFVTYIAVLAILLYAISYDRREHRAITSAVRAVWRGNCRMSCLHHSEDQGKEQSSSSTPPALDQAEDSKLSSSVNCDCGSCPCLLIEKFLISCGPAMRIYCSTRQATFNLFSGLYERLMREYNSNMSLPRVQLVQPNRYDSSQNFTITRSHHEQCVGPEDVNIKDQALPKPPNTSPATEILPTEQIHSIDETENMTDTIDENCQEESKFSSFVGALHLLKASITAASAQIATDTQCESTQTKSLLTSSNEKSNNAGQQIPSVPQLPPAITPTPSKSAKSLLTLHEPSAVHLKSENVLLNSSSTKPPLGQIDGWRAPAGLGVYIGDVTSLKAIVMQSPAPEAPRLRTIEVPPTDTAESIHPLNEQLRENVCRVPAFDIPVFVCPKCKQHGVTCIRGCRFENDKKK